MAKRFSNEEKIKYLREMLDIVLDTQYFDYYGIKATGTYEEIKEEYELIRSMLHDYGEDVGTFEDEVILIYEEIKRKERTS